ncbi:hypothetical protein [Flavobacterium phragmitis]|uniref:Uncharacterized protein n=1 Tax=Flavobacterium phragmitis TaxID=739143 RepID=A0A1I1RWR3_9FLAO|nr:hypothetical protein [Flavobacterium phragmitis]SFD38701.1 hypothetical protein SAMN05216297_107197 [Flavobacterium phragmitis]
MKRITIIPSLLLICICTIFFCCAQSNPKTPSNIQTNHKSINAGNIVEEASKMIANYTNEPVYALRYNKSYCNFELYVNDILVFTSFEDSSPLSSSAVFINHTIFHSGKQKITYKMYPIGKVEDSKEIYNTFRDNTYLKFKLTSYNKNNKEADNIEYMTYHTPGTVLYKSDYDEDIKFEGTGKKYYENSFDITVNVPYALHPGFEQAQDLRKMDKKALEAKLLQAYQQLQKVYADKNMDEVARTMFENFSIQMASEYNQKKDIAEAWEQYEDIITSKTFQIQPLTNSKLTFFADGRLVGFMKDTIANNFRGKPAFWAKINYADKIEKAMGVKGFRPIFMYALFYIPEGKSELVKY